MVPKLLAIDLDGTTLNSQGTISEKNKTYLRKITETGAQLVIATGLSVYSASDFLETIGVQSAYIVPLNGSAVFKWQNPEPLMVTEMPTGLVHEIVANGDSDQVNIYFSTIKNSYVLIRDESLMSLFIKSLELNYIHDLSEMGSDIDHISKMLYCTKNPAILTQLIEQTEALAVEAVKPDDMCLELTVENTSKADGLRYLGEQLGIQASEMAAVGDSENDFEMLKYVGNGIVMANGMPHIKAIADYVTLSNDEDGLAHAIAHLLK